LGGDRFFSGAIAFFGGDRFFRGRSLFVGAIGSSPLTAYSRDSMKLCYDNICGLFTQTYLFTFFNITMTIKIAEILDLNIQYITNKDGEKTAVVLQIQEFELILNITNQFLQENYPETPDEFAQNDIWNIAQKITEDLTEEELQ
jgi:hypothetical protein